MNRYIGWALLIAFFFGIHLSADQAITITARPAVIPAKGSALLKVIVERNAMNRTLVWEVDGRAYYRSSTMQLEGCIGCAKLFLHAERSARGELRCPRTSASQRQHRGHGSHPHHRRRKR